MVDIYRVTKQFERGFLSHTDLSEPPDDRKNSLEMAKYPRQIDVQPEDSDIVIATMVYNFDKGTMRIERNI